MKTRHLIPSSAYPTAALLMWLSPLFGLPLAVHAAPEVVAWGDNTSGQTDVPSGLSNVVAIAAGGGHSLALGAEGRVVAWGWNDAGQTDVPSGLSNVVAITAGNRHSLALASEGRVVAWGNNWDGQTDVPGGLSNVVAIAAARNHSLALTAEGRVVAWGANWQGQTNAPCGLSNVVAIVAGSEHSLALTAEGRVVAWGSGSYWNGSDYVPITVPSGLSNVVAIAAGGAHSLALCGLPPGVAAPAWAGPRFLVATAHRPFHHRIMVRNGATAYGADGLPPGLSLDPGTGLITGQSAQAGTYPVVFSATNNVGSDAWTVTLFVNEPSAPAIAIGRLVMAGLGSGFHYEVVAYNAPERYGVSGLPTGLVLDARTGVITGVPVEFGDFEVSLMVSNRYGQDTGALTLRVLPVVAWGNNDWHQTTVPSGLSNVVAIAAGGNHSLALTAEGRVMAWGSCWNGSTDVLVTAPSGLSNVVAIATGYDQSLARTAEGKVVAWGGNDWGKTVVPNGLSNVVAIAAGEFHSLALLRQPTVPTPRLALSRGVSGLVLQAHGAPGISCQLLRASRLPGPWLPSEPATFTDHNQLLRAPDTSALAQFFRLLRK